MEKTLLADMGGTNIRFKIDGCKDIAYFKCADFKSFTEVLTAYLNSCKQRPKNFILAAPTPAKGDVLTFVNNPWKFSIRSIQKKFDFDTFKVINDFQAQALAISQLKPMDKAVIGNIKKASTNAPSIILGAGTGLGMGILLPNLVALSSEGGHVSATATCEKEEKIIHFASKKFGRVSAERLISGAGLSLIYEYETGLVASSETILQQAVSGDKKARLAVLQMFAFLGSVCGDMALTLCSTGGVYLSGGVIQADGALDILLQSDFRKRFEDKGRHSGYISQIPTYAITKKDTAFLGLSACAKTLYKKNKKTLARKKRICYKYAHPLKMGV